MKKKAKYYVKKLDEWWADKIKLRDKKCIICGSKKKLQAAHIISRTNRTVRWKLANGVCLCLRHHIFWQQNNPLEFIFTLIKLKGMKFLEDLLLKSKVKVKRSIDDYIEMCNKRGIKIQEGVKNEQKRDT